MIGGCGVRNREISMAPACVILSLGLWSSISAPLGRGSWVMPTLGGLVLDFV